MTEPEIVFQELRIGRASLPETVFEELPEDDLFRTLGALPDGATLAEVAAYLLEVTLSYTEACRRLATLEPHGFALLTAIYNGSAPIIQDIASQLSRDGNDQDQAGGPGPQDG